MTIIYWSIGWLGGLWLAAMLPLPTSLRLLIGILALLAAILWRKDSAVSLALVMISAAGLAGVRYDLSRSTLDSDHIAFYNESSDVTITGWVEQIPDVYDTSQQLTVSVESMVGDSGAPLPVQGKVLVRTFRFPLIAYGARLQLTGNLTEPDLAAEFDYPAYLARKDIFSTMDFPTIQVLDGNAGKPLLRALTAVRERAQRAINQMLPDPQAALLNGILLGNDQGLPRDLEDAFKATGMTHIIAISGFNIAIIAGLLLQGGRMVGGRRWGAWIALCGVALYTLLVGAEASVVRAAIMGALFIIAAQLLGRPTFAPAALFTAAFFMTLLNPNILWDIGFQLSMAATLGLMLFVGPGSAWMESHLQLRLGNEGARSATGFLGDIVLTTLAAFVFTLPVLLYHFGTISIVSLPANLLILPVQSWLMLWGGAAALLGTIHPLLGQVPAWVDWLFLTYTIDGVRFFASLPLTTIPLRMPGTMVLLVYAGLAGIAWLAQNRQGGREVLGTAFQRRRTAWAALGVTAVLALLTVVAIWHAPDGRLHVTFLDVGQGDAILIQSPRGRQMLVDGGAYPTLLLSRLGDQLPFWDKHIDIVLATHPDTDHVAGLVDVLARYNVDQFVGNGAESGDNPSYAALMLSGQEHAVPNHIAAVGDVIQLDQDVTLEVLHTAGTEELNDNDNSIVVQLRYGNLVVLLTGDGAEDTEKQLLADGRLLPATVLKAGHHGSNSSTSAAFLTAVHPQYVVISSGADNRYGHPHPDTLQRIKEAGAVILRTDQQGTIEFVSDGTRLWWR